MPGLPWFREPASPPHRRLKRFLRLQPRCWPWFPCDRTLSSKEPEPLPSKNSCVCLICPEAYLAYSKQENGRFPTGCSVFLNIVTGCSWQLFAYTRSEERRVGKECR